ncbi:hypothetical protein BIFGAL_03824 [Bifidobacterium gallicum DSM 20093 = LMG 11596]|uniref:Uncharacterized protein n=1 Tax=Bifidobacterium gallicum DSM 20093 = LMG 11596 TaxID=561180 RepID=D1NVD9_9BIFI|nr:hypothetical protein BIFGAL_03824 [Bifidobacterium gallicum DSM 20093 = LMG 11596]
MHSCCRENLLRSQSLPSSIACSTRSGRYMEISCIRLGICNDMR